jgi:hypothetical protein
MKTVKQGVSFAIFISLVTLLLFAPSGLSAAPSAPQAGYKPQVTYKGEFIPTAIYYKNPESPFWLRMSKSNNYLNVVKCPAALRALNNAGKWLGHLNQDGSCGPTDEPSLFALGNRINSDAIASGEEISK